MVSQKKSSAAVGRVDNFWSLKELVRRLKKKKNSELDDFIVIGIDFGTTYAFYS